MEVVFGRSAPAQVQLFLRRSSRRGDGRRLGRKIHVLEEAADRSGIGDRGDHAERTATVFAAGVHVEYAFFQDSP